MPLPSAADVTELISGISAVHKAKYLTGDQNRTLPLLWVSLMDTTFVLGKILNNHYRANSPEHPAGLIETDRTELLRCRSSFPLEDTCDNPVILSHLYHLHVYYEYESNPCCRVSLLINIGPL